jgi:hypothetical protein
MPANRLTAETAAHLAAVALDHVGREYPNSPGHVLAGPDDARTPRGLHPIFYGSFDWHSSVHTHWTLARLKRRFPGAAFAPAVADLFHAQFTPAKVAAECAYLVAPTARGFERPYGWGWLLKLAEELAQHENQNWSQNLAPLATVVVRRFGDFLPLATYPTRSGTHSNDAFAMRLAADYAEVVSDRALTALLRETAERWYAADADCPAWGEPGGEDFLSPTLIEAECMRRLLPVADFAPWLARFLPRIAEGEPATLFRPAAVSDRTDGKIAHLDGLNLSRAWCWRSIAPGLPVAARAAAEDAAERHLAASLPHIADDYMGSHWLASFALLALDG